MLLVEVTTLGLLILFSCMEHSQGLECTDCADFVINGSIVGNVVQSVLNTFPNIRTPNCNTAKPGSGIKMTTCPTNPSNSDKVYSCASYSGTVTVNVGVLLVPRVSINVVDRECVLVEKGLRTGCYEYNHVPQNAATLQRVLGKLSDFGALDFKGHLCVVKDVTSGSAKIRSVSVLLMTSILLFTRTYISLASHQ